MRVEAAEREWSNRLIVASITHEEPVDPRRELVEWLYAETTGPERDELRTALGV